MFNSIRFQRALFKDTGTYNTMYMRPYETQVNQNHVERINELTRGGRSITPQALAGIANEFIRPDAQYQSPIYIENGWDENRLRFILELDYYLTSDDGNRVIENYPVQTKILQGYTDHLGVGNGGAIDHRMRLYFNNIVTLRRSRISTAAGVGIQTTVSSVDQFINGSTGNSPYVESQPPFAEPYTTLSTNQNNVGGNYWLMRPEEVFRTMGNDALISPDQSEGVLFDFRNSFFDSPLKRSKRKNNLAPHYVSEIMNHYGQNETFHSEVADYSEIMNHAADSVIENTLYDDPFFNKLKMDSTSFVNGGNVTYGELCALFPEFDHVATFLLDTPTPIETGRHTQGETEYWNTSTNETIWATILSQALPSIMMDLMITGVSLSATNQTLDGNVIIQIYDVSSFTDKLDMTPYIENLKFRLITEVIKGLTMNNEIDFSLTARVNISGETHLSLSIAGGPLIDYVTPSFCDGLFSPVLTNNEQHLTQVAHELSLLSGHISNPYTNIQNSTVPGVFSNGEI